MTKEELAAQLTGHEYGQEISKALEAEAQAAGLVVVFGYSDDNVEMRGAWHKEYGAWDGTELLLTAQGVWNEDACSEQCPYYRRAYAEAQQHGQTLEALWDVDGYSWMYKTMIPHATFEIVEEGEPYCRGIVFALADLRTGHADTSIALTWKRYRRTGLSEMRPYVIGEDLTGIWVHPLDTPGAGGMIARNPQDHADQWYVTPHFFRGKMEAVEEEE